MSRHPRLFGPLLIGLATLVASPRVWADDAENYRQLQAMPRERRVALSESLERFDKLDPAEQATIRKLDAEIAGKDPVEQARYRALLRRYHLWSVGLTDAQRAELKSADSPEARFNLARKIRQKEREAPSPGARAFGIRTGDYGLVGPYEAAHLLRVWNRLTPARKAELGREQERGRLFAEIRALHKSVGVPFQPFPPAEERRYDARLDADEAFKKELGPVFARRVDAHPKKAEVAPVDGPARRFELRYAEFLYFEEQKPKAVSQQNLERFSESCPAWLHAMVDPLSADDARAYLTCLYRLLYPEPGEMPPDLKSARPAALTSPPVKPAARKPGPAGSF